MRFAYISSNYAVYLTSFYAMRPLLALEPFAIQEKALLLDGFGWNGHWVAPMEAMGYEARDFYLGNAFLDKAWWREQGGGMVDLPDSATIALQRLAAYAPDVVFYDHGDAALLQSIKALPSRPLAIGWEGGGLSRQACWPLFDLLLSCAPESVEKLQAAGVPAAQMHHAFNPALLERVGQVEAQPRVSFFGQLVRDDDFHRRRELDLVKIGASGLPFDLYSPSYSYTSAQMLKARLRMLAYVGYQGLGGVVGRREKLAKLPLGWLAEQGMKFPKLPVNPRLRANLRPALYGLDMYASIARSAVCLNIHADNTPHYASNMRLFEVTGMGSCLLTDRRRNIGDLFTPDREVVVYESLEDCIEKMRWLIEHPEKASEIAAAGQARTLRDNTYFKRGEQLHEHISRLMRSRTSRA